MGAPRFSSAGVGLLNNEFEGVVIEEAADLVGGDFDGAGAELRG